MLQHFQNNINTKEEIPLNEYKCKGKLFDKMIVLQVFDFATCQRAHSSVASLYISDWQLYTNNYPLTTTY